ncbi:MAG: DUF1572 domain-containing protein [Gemmatimonadaceae bacterium]|nr:DUF1572 domain-containing protein [Gemmatimonadaceae bacterium]
MPVIRSAEAEYQRYKALADRALAQVPEVSLSARSGAGNSLAIICWHVSGNLESRFTDFLSADGEKPWREREEEVAPRAVTRAELETKWERGWTVLFATLATLGDDDLPRMVTIRAQPLSVEEAVMRSLAHVAYHVGQIVDQAHAIVGASWSYLSIPPGGTAAYNANPTKVRVPPRGTA